MLKIDLAVYSERGELVLTVEIKNIRNVSVDWATQLRRNIFAHGTYPRTPYFLLATPDTFFLWRDQEPIPNLVPPDFTVNAYHELKPYFKEFNVEPENVSGFIFEQIVGRWLKGVMYPAYRDSGEPLSDWLTSSGLAEAVYQGDFQFEQAA